MSDDPSEGTTVHRLLRKIMRAGANARRHQARYLSPSVFYTFCFSLPEGTNIFELSEALLRNDVATFATISHSEELRLSHRFQELMRVRRDAVSLVEWDEVVNGKLGFLSWVRKHPRIGVPILWQLVSTWAKSIVGRRPEESVGQEEPETRTNSDIADGAVRFIDESMANARLILGARGIIDRRFFKQSYLNEVPFIRLELERTHVTSAYFDDEPFECYLLLHRSGVAVLSFGIASGKTLDTDQLIGMAMSESARFQKTRMPTSISGMHSLPPEAALEDETDTEMESGVFWRSTTWRDGISLTEIFDVYQSRILEAISKGAAGGNTHPTWFCYPLLVVNGLACCGSRRAWTRAHHKELAGLLLRVPNYGTLSEGMVRSLPDDEALTQAESKYFNISHALNIRWRFGDDPGPDIQHDLWTMVLVENALLQHWQLTKVEWLLSAPNMSSKSFYDIQESAMTGMVEYRQATVTFGSARDTIRRLLSRFEADRTYAQITEQLGMLAQRLEAKSTEVAARRTVLAASLGFLVAVVFGLPAIDESIRLLTQIPPDSAVGRLLGPLHDYAISNPSLSWALYGLLVAAAIALVGQSIRWRVDLKRTRVAPRSFGIKWQPGELHVELVDRPYRHGFARPNERQESED